MTLATRIIPTLLVRGRQLVKGKQFNSWRSVGDALQAMKIHQARGVDEIIYLDIAATPEGRGPDLKMVELMTRDCFCPITVGGGVRSVSDVQDLLNAGADKVAIKTAAYQNYHLVRDLADKFGSQAIVVAVDYIEAEAPWPIAMNFEDQGAGEILLTCVDREGTMRGYDLSNVEEVVAYLDIPVIAHGGCSGYEDMCNAIQAGASAVAAGALFQFTDCTPRGAADYLSERGIEVRR